MKRLFAEVKGVRRLLVVSVLLGMAGGVALILESASIADIASRAFLGGEGLASLVPAFGLLLAWIALRAVVQSAGDYAAAQLALGVKADLRLRLLRKLAELGPNGAKGERSGELTATVYEGVEQLESYLAKYIPQMALSMFVPAAVFAVVAGLDVVSAAVLAVTMPLLVLFMILVGVAAKAKAEKQFKTLGRLGGHFLDVVRGLPTLKMFGRSKAQLEILSRISEDYRKTTMGTLRLAFLSAFVMELFATLSTAIVAVFLGLRLIDGRIGFEHAFLVLLLTPEFYQPVRALGAQFHSSTNGMSAAKRILALLDLEPPGWPEREGAREPVVGPAGCRIEFRGVSLRYPGADRDAAAGLSFALEPGERVVVVGPTGAGKSTVLDLLQGFAKPTEGAILVGGIDLAELSMNAWRERLAVVPQQSRLFAGTVRDNVRLGRPEASEEELAAALEAAGAAGFVRELPDGLDTRLGEAARLSGGQAQRLALARALLRAAPVLLLDEPATGLDLESEEALARTLDRALAGRMSVTVSHRMGTALRADRVLVIADGRLVEAGAPAELLAAGGLFAALARAAEGEETEADSVAVAGTVGTVGGASIDGTAGTAGTAGAIGAIGAIRTFGTIESVEMADSQELGAAMQSSEVVENSGGQAPSIGLAGLRDSSGTEEMTVEAAPRSAADNGPACAESTGEGPTTGTLRRMLGFVAPYKGRLALAALLGFLTVAANVGLMGTSGYLIAKAALRPETVLLLWVPIVGVRFFGLSRGVLRYVERLVSHDLTFRILHRIRVWLYERLEPAGATLLENRRGGDVLGAMTSDIGQLQNLYLRVLAPPLVALLTGALGVVVLAAHDLSLAGLLLAGMLAAGIALPWLSSRQSRKHGAALVRERAGLYAETAELVSGQRELALFGRARDRLEGLSRRQAGLGGLQREHNRTEALTSGGMLAATRVTMAAVLAAAAHLAGLGRIEPVAIPALAMMTLACFEAIAPLPAAFQQLGQTLASADRLFRLADEGRSSAAEEAATGENSPSPAPAGDAVPSDDSRFVVSSTASEAVGGEGWEAKVERLGFRYGEGEPYALRDVSITLRQGRRVAVVGESGAGKSTLIQLLLGLRACEEGTIRLSGAEPRERPETGVRASFAVVSQNVQLFNATAAANIRLGRPEATDEEVRAAARLALVDERLERLPEGYDTVIGEGGSLLSGGERQRLALARALLLDAPAVLFDEPATGLDPLTERAFLGQMDGALANKAVLWITHRLTGLERMDEIVVLRRGRVVERGRHEELLARRGYYYRLWRLERERDWHEILKQRQAGA